MALVQPAHIAHYVLLVFYERKVALIGLLYLGDACMYCAGAKGNASIIINERSYFLPVLACQGCCVGGEKLGCIHVAKVNF